MKRIVLGFFLSLCAAQQPAPQKRERTIEGVVRDGSSGLPLAGVSIRANGTDWQTVTDLEGRYVLRGLEPTSYIIAAPKANGYSSTWRRVNLKSALTAQADLSLVRESVIAGRITDAEGRPVQRAKVTVRSYYSQGNKVAISTIRAVSTDDAGYYEIRGLKQGRYLLKVVPLPLGVMKITPESSAAVGASGPVFSTVRTYYPNSLSADGAARIRLDGGQRMDALDIKLQEVPVVCITSAVSGSMHRASVQLYDVEEVPTAPIASGGVGDGERFRVCGVSSGRYRLQAVIQESGQLLQGEAVFSVGAHDMEVPSIVLVPPAIVTGRVVVEGDQALPSTGTVSLFDNERSGLHGESPDAQLDRNTGDFSLSVAPGNAYRLDVSHMPPEYYVKTALLDLSDALVGRLRVGPGKSRLEIVLGNDGGQIAGVVNERHSQAVSDALVVLVRMGTFDPGPQSSWTTRADQNGEFAFTGRPPGDYYLLAFPSSTLEEDVSLEAISRHLSRASRIAFSAQNRRAASIGVVPFDAK